MTMAKFSSIPKNSPLLVKLFNLCCLDKLSPKAKLRFFQIWTLFLTFLAYASYHLSRKTISVVKSTLNPQVHINEHGDPYGPQGWAPFNTGAVNADGYRDHGKKLLGTLDTVFLFAYAFGIFFSGHIADRSNLRYFLSFGMLGCGLLSILFALAQFCGIHELWYFIFVQLAFGFYQSTGWPTVVAIVGKWFPKGKRGFIMGVWNSHTSVGNILGSIIPGAVLAWGWGWSFVIPGVISASLGILMFLGIQVEPSGVGLDDPSDAAKHKHSLPSYGALDDDESEPLLVPMSDAEYVGEHEAISLWQGIQIPGVLAFSLCLFFCKLVAYTFMYWLPYYIENTPIGGKHLSDSTAAYLSTLFDVGGIIGGILAGTMSDIFKSPGTVSFTFLILTVPAIFLYREVGPTSYASNVGLMILTGVLVNGPYGLITTAVSADLGNHSSLRGNPKALATVTALIDGTGSIGAALGPFLAGAIPDWNNVFYMLMGSACVAALLLLKLVYTECRHCCCHKPRQPREIYEVQTNE